MQGAPDALGERFRAAREARGLSLSDVAEQIRIRSVYLAAIEEGNWNTIGAPVYIRGFLRTYARLLGIDPEEAVTAFNETQPAPEPPEVLPARQPAREPMTGRHGSLLIWVAAAVAVLLIAFVVYNELTLRRTQNTAAVTVPASAIAGSASPGTPVASPGPSAPVAKKSRPRPGFDGARTLALLLSAPSWLRVTVDGSVSMEGTFPTGTSKTFHGKSARVRIGNAGGVELYVDGKKVGKLGKSGDVVERAFTL